MWDVPPLYRTKDVANSAPKGGGVETGRNRSRDWMCGIKNWLEENEDSLGQRKTIVLIFLSCLNFLQLSFS
jgi:hypothetical protein